MSTAHRLAPPEKEQLTLGFVRLTDSAPLIVASELGFYQSYGLDVSLEREVSWANVRDRLVTGDLDAAHMLAPLPLTTSMGLGGMRAQIITGLALSLNGNAITVSQPLAAEIRARGADAATGALATVRALRDYLDESGEQLTFAAAHTFSSHILLLRHWLMAGGIDPDRELRIIVLPPEQMVDSLSRGIIDGFCVGEPWNSIAVQHGVGAVQATGHQIWNNSMEKVLAVTETWHGNCPGSHLRLRLALMEACRWLSREDNRRRAASILSQARYLDMPEKHLLPSLTGSFAFSKESGEHHLPHFHVFGRFQAGFPWRSEGEWQLQKLGGLLGKSFSREGITAQVQRSFRTDLYREAARVLNVASPGSDHKTRNEHASAWEYEPGIELGADLVLPLPDAL
jgi:nitrate/nitrite transport system substrate-binding protein